MAIERLVFVYRVLKLWRLYRRADKSLARSGMKQTTATEDFVFHVLFIIIIGGILILFIYITRLP